MQLVAINTRAASPLRMPLTHTPKQAEQLLIGQTLKNLRERAGFTQKQVGTAMGLTAAGYQYYEAGDRKFTAERVQAALAAIGVGEYEYEAEKARVLGMRSEGGVREEGTPFIYDVFGRNRSGALGPEIYDITAPQRRIDLRQMLGGDVEAVEIAGDRVSPWGESGELVLYDRGRAPRRGKGCVVQMKSGEAHVLLYEKSDGSSYFLKELYPEERVITYQVADVVGVYPVILRGD